MTCEVDYNYLYTAWVKIYDPKDIGQDEQIMIHHYQIDLRSRPKDGTTSLKTSKESLHFKQEHN